MQERIQPATREGLSIDYFDFLAEEGNWQEFDLRAIEISNDFSFLRWTEQGLKDQNPNRRDLAVSILINTVSVQYYERFEDLVKMRDEDENIHLRRRAAIALRAHGDFSVGTMDTLLDAYFNDPELKDDVAVLIGMTE